MRMKIDNLRGKMEKREILELKCTIYEIKNLLHMLDSQMDTAVERVNGHEDRISKIT